MDKEELLIIFVKNPEVAKVKTRLAETVGEQQAIRIYRQLLDYTRGIVEPLGVGKQVWYAHSIPDEDDWDSVIFQKKVQQGKDLGCRMSNAFEKAFKENYQRVIIIGSDCASLTVNILIEAFESLHRRDLVIGPATDGGYYLLGMNAFRRGLFENIKWSTPEVLPETMQKARLLGLEVELLSELNDVDTEADWEQVRSRFG